MFSLFIDTIVGFARLDDGSGGMDSDDFFIVIIYRTLFAYWYYGKTW